MNYLNYILFGILALAIIIFVMWKWTFIAKALDSADPNPSTKRLSIFLCLMALIMSYFAAVFLNLVAPSFMWDGLLGVVVVGLGLTVTEKVLNKPKDNSGNNNNQQNQ